MSRPLHATIDLGALRHNLSRIRQAAPDARVWAVVKANAYGHGLSRVYEALRAADGFALLDLQEAQHLREWGWRGPILLLEGVFDARDLEWCSRLNLWHVVHTQEQIEMLRQHKTHAPLRVFLKLNSGMNRLGFAPEHYRLAWVQLNALEQVDDVVHMTHFANADQTGGTQEARAVFERTVRDLPGEWSLANSAALLREPDTAADWVRPGIALYGASPDDPAHSALDWGLQPVMGLHSRVIAVQTLQAGQATGYGGCFVAVETTRIGIVAVGYADGYPRHAPSGTPVLVEGQRTAVLGRVSMDMLAVDLSLLPQAGVGSAVLLWGSEGEQILSIDEVARCAGTVAYELMCALAARVPVQVR